MTLILGLGNPGKQYEKSRHNVGFSVIDEFANKIGITLRKVPNKPYESAKTKIANEDVMLVKPLTFMNASGDIFPYFRNENIKRVIVCVDNMDLNVGKVRFKFAGSSAGHNGLKSIIAHYGNDFYRLYVGVGRPDGDVINHVLGSLSKDDRTLLDSKIKKTVDVLINFIQTNDFERAQRDLSL